jgi:FkbM family methyltransferase
MTKWFIDCGAHLGESVRLFRSQYPGASDFRVVSFEANPKHAAAWEAPDLADVEFHDQAVWVEDGTVSFYVEAVTDLAASVHPENRYITGRQDRITVPCIDLSAWMRQRLSPDDFVVLKLDIEGSEYEVLERMLAEGTFQSLVDVFYVEYHRLQRPTITTERHNAIIDAIEACGSRSVFWHAARVGARITEEVYGRA